MARIKDPGDAPSRRLLWPQEAIEEMVEALGGTKGPEARQRVARGFLFALETGMRAGEVFGLRRQDVRGRVARLHTTKNGDPREVPLSPRALEILEGLDERLFDVDVASADAMFRKYRPAHLRHLRFHDARHTAATRLAMTGRVGVLEMCQIFGWRDPKFALVYFHPSADDLAAKIWGEEPSASPETRPPLRTASASSVVSFPQAARRE
jgi:integrase